MKKGVLFILFAGVLAAGGISCAEQAASRGAGEAMDGETTLKKAPEDAAGRFYSPWMAGQKRSFTDLLRWRFSSNQWAKEKKRPVSFNVVRPDIEALERTGGDYIVWLGHSTVLIKAAGRRILTDPVFWDVNFLIRRETPLPIDPEELPPIDFVLISHSHYDHMNTASLEFLARRHDPYFVTGPGYEGYFKSIGSEKNLALNWTESYEAGGLRITSLPAQHWSKRGLFDTDRMLWCSFLVEGGGRKYYFAGDTGYFKGFKDIGSRWGPIDVMMVPAGSYEPRWFMKDNHLNPAEAVRAAEDARARVVIPIHWGTFDLTDEPLGQPMELMRKISSGTNNPPRLEILEHGGHYQPGE